jgi:general secretion pathway protein N
MTSATALQPSAAFRFPWRWVAVGVAAYVVFLIGSFPAARLATRLQANGIVAAGISGSIWNGRAAAMQISGIALGSTEWHVSPWRLFVGTLSADIRSKRDDGYIDGTVRVGLSGAISLHHLRGSVPVGALSRLGLPGGGTAGWSGALQLDLEVIAFANRWPTEIKGAINVANLVGPAQQPTQLGGYRIIFPVANAPITPGELHGSVTSLEDAPVDVLGTMKLSANRTYEINAQVATRANAPANIVKALQYLGPPDAQGKRPFSFAGSL